MAFPVVQTTAESAQTTAGTSHPITLPSGLASGDVLVVITAYSATNVTFTSAVTPSGSLTELVDPNVNPGPFIGYFRCLGTESALTLTSSGSVRTASIAYRISGAHASTALTIGTVGSATTDAPNPGNCNPGVSADYLWITCFGQAGEEIDDDTWCNNAATNYTNLLQITCGTAGATTANCQVASCQRTNTAASEDAAWPAASTDQSLAVRAYTIAVPPAPAGTANTSSLTGSLSFTGSQVKQTNKALTAAASFVGAITRAVRITRNSALTFVGDTARRTSRSLAGALSFTGTFASSRITLKALTGALSFSGSQRRSTGKALTGAISFVGSVPMRTARALSAAVTFTGTLPKRTSRALTGAVSFVGSLASSSGVHNYTQALTAALTFTGNTAKRTSRSLTATLSFVGATAKQTARSLTGALSFTGAIRRQTGKALTAAATFTGSTSRAIRHFVTATLSFTGAHATGIAGHFTQALTATLSFSGSTTRRTARQLTAALSFTGAFRKQAGKALTATLTLSGNVGRGIRRALSSSLSFAGSFASALQGVVEPAAIAVTQFALTAMSTLTSVVNSITSSTARVQDIATHEGATTITVSTSSVTTIDATTDVL